MPLPAGEIDAQVCETSPRPGPRLFKHAPIAEKDDSKSNPVITNPRRRIIKDLYRHLEKQRLLRYPWSDQLRNRGRDQESIQEEITQSTSR